MAKTPDYFCNYPFPRGERRPCMMRQGELKKFLYTEEFPETSDLNWLIASTDQVTVGEYQLSPGSHFEPADVHAGDEIYYVMWGGGHDVPAGHRPDSQRKTGRRDIDAEGMSAYRIQLRRERGENALYAGSEDLG